MPEPKIPETVASIAEALIGTLRSTAELAARITEQQSQLPTPCEGWTVRDQVAHICGLESRLLGRPANDDHPVPEGLTYLKTDVGRFMEIDVDIRRALPWSDIQAEILEVAAERAAMLRSAEYPADAMLPTPFGPRPAKASISLRVFDAWAHEQDIRDAVGIEGGEGSAAAEISCARLRASLNHMMGQAGLEAQCIEVIIDGHFSFTHRVGEGEPAATLRMPQRTFTRLGFGRSSADRSTIVIQGDTAVGQQFIANMAITP